MGTSGKLALPDVTLVIYEMAAYESAVLAVSDCLAKADFGAVHVWTDRPEEFAAIPGARIFDAPSGLAKAEGQSALWREIPRKVETGHILNIEWDSGIADEDFWDSDFLRYDFIGATWPWYTDRRVGNGGFALISTRLLCFLAENQEEFPYGYPWDDVLGREHRPALEDRGFVWAPDEMADRFSFEYGVLRPTFGFHNCQNFPLVLSLRDLNRRILAANDYVQKHPAWRVMLMRHKAEAQFMNTPHA